jgi:mannose/cellobiose epimerase-like protein (N-acyl-D-glucosamine 2-epimerase family)
MDLSNPVIQLCIEGSRAEFENRPEDARRLYQQAWDIACDDYEACIAAHYLARFQPAPEETLRWNQEALKRANLVADERVRDFYPSLYLNLGHSYEMLGHQPDAQKFYALAAELRVTHR